MARTACAVAPGSPRSRRAGGMTGFESAGVGGREVVEIHLEELGQHSLAGRAGQHAHGHVVGALSSASSRGPAKHRTSVTLTSAQGPRFPSCGSRTWTTRRSPTPGPTWRVIAALRSWQEPRTSPPRDRPTRSPRPAPRGRDEPRQGAATGCRAKPRSTPSMSFRRSHRLTCRTTRARSGPGGPSIIRLSRSRTPPWPVLRPSSVTDVGGCADQDGYVQGQHLLVVRPRTVIEASSIAGRTVQEVV